MPDVRRAETPSAPPATGALAGLTVRPATRDDLDTVLAFRLALLAEHAHNPMYGRLRPDAPERARSLYAAQLVAAGEVTFLAVVDASVDGGPAPSRPIGVLRCIESRGSPLLDPARYAYVASVYVVPDVRRHGVVRALMDAAAEWCDERGLDEMRLHTAADNAAGNAAWAALGFEIVEHLRTRRVHPDR